MQGRRRVLRDLETLWGLGDLETLWGLGDLELLWGFVFFPRLMVPWKPWYLGT